MHAETLAPHRVVSSQSITLEKAASILDKYLANSEVHSHLHPDALITPSGTTFGAQGGSTGGVIMHNLRRVAAGLKGNYLEPEPTPEPEGGERNAVDGTKDQPNAGMTDGTAAEDWQDMSEFEREEGAIEVGEVGDRSNFVAQEEIEPGHLSGEGKKRKTDDAGKLDKAARKKAKKAKDKEFRAQKEKARAEQSA
ncbi:hypothetical protein DPSP01_008728 [Paraphaeosphaeria sporulosa]|uniref:Uncharacterized protein n=1 Tax=Paraphaeosphaeria sporulosa TaxID=1460663 RepID=A0A177C0I6_9PLEO|nr:uncharacterized protein CC84DRAFT_297689 [Paraphaeosphaeria sporulosa]OAG00352.1 hypothetical protein CC84DRAFT_297689 [Paraphaeosphaeria sporulosa]